MTAHYTLLPRRRRLGVSSWRHVISGAARQRHADDFHAPVKKFQRLAGVFGRRWPRSLRKRRRAVKPELYQLYISSSHDASRPALRKLGRVPLYAALMQ